MLGEIKKKLKEKRGFTLIELVIVIVIILVLSSNLIPQILKYVDKANMASCKSDAATLLSQVQVDYVAMQAEEETGVSSITEVGNVQVAPKDKGEVTAKDVPDADSAMYHVKSDGSGEVEISSFAYNNGKYTAVWKNGKWTVKKNK